MEETMVLAAATSGAGVDLKKSEQMGPEEMTLAFVTDMTTNVQTEMPSSQSSMMTMTTASPDLERGPRSFSQSTSQMNSLTSTQGSTPVIMSEMLADMAGNENSGMSAVSSALRMSPTTPESVARSTEAITQENSTPVIINPMISGDSSKNADLETVTMATSENSMQVSTTYESTNRPYASSTDSVVDLLVATGRMSTTVRTSTTEATTQIKTTGDSTTMKTTSQSMTATAPKTTIDPMTQPMPTESPSSPNAQVMGTSAKPESANRGGNVSHDLGKLIPMTNGTTMKPAISTTHKDNTNASLNSLLHPQGTAPSKVTATGGTSTSSPSPLLTPRNIKPPMVAARGSKRSMGSPSTTHSTGEYPTMKSSMPTLLQPQI
jgi:hypothetical protein